METMYFVLGMLSIIGVAFVAAIVWGIVKINKLLKTIKQHEEQIKNNERVIWENIHRMRDDLSHRIDEIDVNNDRHMADFSRELDLRFKEVYDEIGHTRSYIDSRIDKATGTLGAKQVIKG
jgi:biopolymer transport protein ExbB/TolQ